jgi:hypothetical protein
VSLLRWRSGGSNTPTIRRLIPHAVTNFRAYLSGDVFGDNVTPDELERLADVILKALR